MAPFGTVQVGRVTLREDRELSRSISNGKVELSLTGQESSPHRTLAQTIQRGQDILNLQDAFVPVLFEQKPELNGYYTVSGVTADQKRYVDQGVNLVPWTMKLDLVGTDSEVDLESRTGGAQTRANDFSGTGERWHAPAGGAIGYYVGSSVPPVVTRVGSDGPMRVYRNIAFGVHPRWACPVDSYHLGRVRFLTGGVERTGTSFAPDPADWSVDNGLVRVASVAGGGVSVDAFTGGAWHTKAWSVVIGGTTVGMFDKVSLIRNDYECVQVRLFAGFVGSRCTVDVSILRGARFAQLYIQNSTATTIAFNRGVVEAGANAANGAWLIANVADADGNKYVVGSAHTIATDVVNGGVSKVSTVNLDLFVGVQINAAPSGDLVADLFNQYLGVPTEIVSGVTR